MGSWKNSLCRVFNLTAFFNSLASSSMYSLVYQIVKYLGILNWSKCFIYKMFHLPKCIGHSILDVEKITNQANMSENYFDCKQKKLTENFNCFT